MCSEPLQHLASVPGSLLYACAIFTYGLWTPGNPFSCTWGERLGTRLYNPSSLIIHLYSGCYSHSILFWVMHFKHHTELITSELLSSSSVHAGHIHYIYQDLYNCNVWPWEKNYVNCALLEYRGTDMYSSEFTNITMQQYNIHLCGYIHGQHIYTLYRLIRMAWQCVCHITDSTLSSCHWRIIISNTAGMCTQRITMNFNVHAKCEDRTVDTIYICSARMLNQATRRRLINQLSGWSTGDPDE